MEKNQLVTVPFKDKIIVNHFELDDDSLVYNVDYENSTLKGKEFVTYLNNINIPSNLYISDNVSYSEKEELLLTWLNHREIFEIDILTSTILDILFYLKEIDDINFKTMFSSEERDKFITDNKEFVEIIIVFLDSILFHLMVQYRFINQEKRDIDIDNADIVPRNIVNVFSFEQFFLYFSKPITPHKIWFIKQFEGRNALIKYFYINKNPLIAFVSCINKESITVDNTLDFMKICKELNEKL